MGRAFLIELTMLPNENSYLKGEVVCVHTLAQSSERWGCVCTHLHFEHLFLTDCVRFQGG